eukprot:982171_1
MSGFVRESLYRHCFGEENGVNDTYTDLKATFFGEGNFIKVNPRFFCVGKKAGGGPCYVQKVGDYERFELTKAVLNVHTSPVLDFDFNPFQDNVIASGSDDCCIAVTKFPMEGVTENIKKANWIMMGHQKKISLLHWHPTAENLLGSSAYDRDIKVWDVTAEEEVISLGDEHPENIFSWEWSKDGAMIMTTCRDRNIRVFDIRSEDPIMCSESFESSKAARGFWVPDKNMVGSVGFSKSSMRMIMFWDFRKMGKALHVKELSQGNSVLVPHYEEGNSVLFLAGKGDSTVKYFELTEQEGFCHFLSEFRSANPQKGVAVMPRRGVDTAKAELAVFYRLLKDSVSPVSIQLLSRTTCQVHKASPATQKWICTAAVLWRLSHISTDFREAVRSIALDLCEFG